MNQYFNEWGPPDSSQADAPLFGVGTWEGEEPPEISPEMIVQALRDGLAVDNARKERLIGAIRHRTDPAPEAG